MDSILNISSPSERRSEIVTILARGYLRLKSRQLAFPGSDLSAVNREDSLEVSVHQSVYAPQKERMP